MTIQLIKNTEENNDKIAVVKFGSSILTDNAGIWHAVHEVYGYVREGFKVLVIVSAIGKTTNQLLEHATNLLGEPAIHPDPNAIAELLATGETKSAALFTIALNGAGILSQQLDHHILQTKGFVLDAQPVKLRKKKILQLFNRNSVLVLPGFIGTSQNHFTTLLGRGGSDFSAVFAGHTLSASRCVLYKDTDGIFNKDPNQFEDALSYQTLSYEDCLKIPYPVVQHKAVKFAEANAFHFRVKSLVSKTETMVGLPSQLHREKKIPQKKKVILLGLGTVGYGVYQHLKSAQHLFEIVGIGVKNPEKYPEISADVVSNLDELLDREADIVIELIGGLDIAEKYITKALQKKCHVVTANKLLIAEKGVELHKIAKLHSVHLLYSAAVCGSVPVLEFLNNLNEQYPEDAILSITGILNGTCNFILDEISKGKSFQKALQIARDEGYAEANPYLDLSGEDSGHKLKIIVRSAFQEELPNFVVQGIHDQIKEASTKLIAHCERKGTQLHAFILPQVISRDHPLAGIQGVDNGIVIKTVLGKTFQLQGKGAGRLPTAESVYADLLTILQDLPENKVNALQRKVAI